MLKNKVLEGKSRWESHSFTWESMAVAGTRTNASLLAERIVLVPLWASGKRS